MRDLTPLIAEVLPTLVALRYDLHQQPEIAFQEHATAARVAGLLAGLPGMTVRTGVAGTGVIATLDADKTGPCVALRADMDALPMTEETGIPYASRVPGCAHACGHVAGGAYREEGLKAEGHGCARKRALPDVGERPRRLRFGPNACRGLYPLHFGSTRILCSLRGLLLDLRLPRAQLSQFGLRESAFRTGLETWYSCA